MIDKTLQNIIQRLKANKEEFPAEYVRYFFVDEAHHACSETIKPIIINDFKNTSILAVTATPYPTTKAKADAKSKLKELKGINGILEYL